MASNRALFVGWNRGISGREADNVELFGSFLGYLTKQAESGKIENFEPVFLSAHGGDLNGFVLIRGSYDQLNVLKDNDDWKNFITAGVYGLDGFGVIEGFLGEGLQDQMERYTKRITK